MLWSIHQGQIILLQSLQLVAPPDSIPSVEQFNEWVAWPGTQPPLHREDEGPIAQVPQEMEDGSSETSTPEPLIKRKRVVETQEVATTSKKSLEATSEPSEPVADTASIQQLADPSTPEDQTTAAAKGAAFLISKLDLKGCVSHNTKEKILYIKDMEEGVCTNKPLLFRGIKYDYWNECMIAHLELIHVDVSLDDFT
ncbi:hypothetical protein JHK86_012309 [Glycine max]|nr:hypothetical protein JHK86_012309 [Glycine max]